ncbi:MAG TPA: ABC transporter substrate-binding protein, partial [Acidimicrobiales bacterium]
MAAIETFDPVASPAGRRLQYLWLVYDSLIRTDADGELVPGLAESWEYNDDNTVFELTLREGLTFTDGAALDAEAVKANLDRALATNGPQSAQLALVESVEAVSPTEVRINLSAPNPSLPVVLSQNLGLMVSPEALDARDLDTNPVGAGPYTLDADDTVPDDHYTFTRNPDYPDADDFPFAEVTIRVIADRTAIFQGVRAGELDAGEGNAEVAAAAEGTDVEILTQPTDTAGVMLLDRQGEIVPALGDVRVRQALNHAVDREAIVESIVRGYGTPTSQFISPGMDGYDESLDDAYAHDPERARQLLAEAGYEDGFTLPILATSESTTVVEAIAGQLEEVGVSVEIVPASPSGLSHDLLEGTHAAVYLPWGMTDTYIDAQFLLNPESAYNPTGASDPEMLALVDEGAAQQPEERDATYRELSARIVEQAWYLPLYVADAIYLVGPDVEDVTLTPHVITPSIRGWQPAA